VAGVQGLSYLRHHSFENDLIRALDDEETAVRREAALVHGTAGEIVFGHVPEVEGVVMYAQQSSHHDKPDLKKRGR
jgi:hypothetical protein